LSDDAKASVFAEGVADALTKLVERLVGLALSTDEIVSVEPTNETTDAGEFVVRLKPSQRFRDLIAALGTFETDLDRINADHGSLLGTSDTSRIVASKGRVK